MKIKEAGTAKFKTRHVPHRVARSLFVLTFPSIPNSIGLSAIDLTSAELVDRRDARQAHCTLILRASLGHP